MKSHPPLPLAPHLGHVPRQLAPAPPLQQVRQPSCRRLALPPQPRPGRPQQLLQQWLIVAVHCGQQSKSTRKGRSTDTTKKGRSTESVDASVQSIPNTDHFHHTWQVLAAWANVSHAHVWRTSPHDVGSWRLRRTLESRTRLPPATPATLRYMLREQRGCWGWGWDCSKQ